MQLWNRADANSHTAGGTGSGQPRWLPIQVDHWRGLHRDGFMSIQPTITQNCTVESENSGGSNRKTGKKDTQG